MSNFRDLLNLTRAHMSVPGNQFRSDLYQAGLRASTKLENWDRVVRVVDFMRYIDRIKSGVGEDVFFRMSIINRQRYMGLPVRIEDEANAWLFALEIARDLGEKSDDWSVALYRLDGTLVDRVTPRSHSAPGAGESLPASTEPTR